MPSDRTLHSLLNHYGAGDPLACRPVAQGLLNHGYRLRTTRGSFFLKHYLDDPDRPERRATHPATIVRQHRATLRLGALGLPVAAPLTGRDGRTVYVLGGRPYALYPWVDGRHRAGSELTTGQSRRLGWLLGRVHLALERVLAGITAGMAGAGGAGGPGSGSARAEETDTLIGELLRLAGRHRPRDPMDVLAERRLLERRALLERYAHRRPAASAAPACGWVHGDFHPFNLLYRGAEPAAIIDWDRLGVQPRAEEAVRAAVIFFLGPDGALDLAKVRAYARAYRLTTGVPANDLAAAVRRVWWERLNDLWMLRWRYQRLDCRADPLFPAAAALVVWWTREYEAVLAAFTG
ncbi:phosphotransferase [Streptantibioticus silvisoli]|jgi:Ser/Thr protein kinase RdoA (MazF antagonist)|uniref:Phosphotransferase n=1 Tax=Streptantibioticus silvisoli TaxID=2705255 RepID=A0ABT6W2R3_9ACTN|nr:phosphotransferase [Streptantibioticus silvisoli]MDI5964277.1 phosphotransferase [Streptantibioticus silvisoli]